MGKTKGVLKRYCVNLLGREELERKTFSWQFALSSAYPTLPSNPQRTHVVIWNGYCSVSKVRVMVNFMLIWMGHRMPRYFVKCFWVCLGGCFWTRLESELVDWVKQSILPNLGGHHLIRWGTDENKRSRGRENLPSGWWTGNIGLLLPLNWDLHQQLLWSWGLGVTLRAHHQILGSPCCRWQAVGLLIEAHHQILGSPCCRWQAVGLLSLPSHSSQFLMVCHHFVSLENSD